MRRTKQQSLGLWRGALAATVAITGFAVTGPAASSVEAQADQIPDDGLPAAPIAASPLVSRRTEVLQAGVVGINKANDTFAVTDISVAAIAEIGDTIYIGGKFTQVETAADLQRYDQRFLAAFDRTTGAWIDTFRPTIDGNVWDLKATDDGRLIVAGQFTNVNGEPNTSAVAMLDPATGAVDPNWRVDLQLTGSSNWPLARALDIQGGLVYIGGNFTRITGSNGVDTKRRPDRPRRSRHRQRRPLVPPQLRRHRLRRRRHGRPRLRRRRLQVRQRRLVDRHRRAPTGRSARHRARAVGPHEHQQHQPQLPAGDPRATRTRCGRSALSTTARRTAPATTA